MKNILSLVLLLNIISFGQQNNKDQIFKRYDYIDTSYIEDIQPVFIINSKNWSKYTSNDRNLTFYYPSDFSIKKYYNPIYCDSIIWIGSYKDTLFFNYVGISLFKGNMEEALQNSVFQKSKLNWQFTRDSLGNVIDSGKTYWIMYGYQGMQEVPDIIKGNKWIGFECEDTRGVYSDQGYEGLTMSQNIFLFYKRENNCSIILEYTDRPYFYDEEIDKSENDPKYFLFEDTFYRMAEIISQNN